MSVVIDPTTPKRRGRPPGSKNKKRQPVDDLAPRTCIVCGHAKAPRMFGVGPTNHTTGRAYRKRTCLDCQERARRAAGIPERHQRYNAHGEVWCNNCKRYLPADRFKRHPSRPEQYWSYCRECTRVLDRLRWTGERRAKTNASRRVRQRRYQAAARQEKQDFVLGAMVTLRRRGLTKADAVRLTGLSFSTYLAIERKEMRVTKPVSARFAIVLKETAYLPLAPEPVGRKRWPHPDTEQLLARIAPQLAKHPVRSRWKGREA